MEAKKIINSLQKRGLKGSIQRFRQGPQKSWIGRLLEFYYR